MRKNVEYNNREQIIARQKIDVQNVIYHYVNRQIVVLKYENNVDMHQGNIETKLKPIAQFPFDRH